MHDLHVLDRIQTRPVADALWHLPVIAAGVIAAYELGTGHIVPAALVAALLLAFQGRMDKAAGAGRNAAGALQRVGGDGGTLTDPKARAPYMAKPLVLDGGSLEHRRHQADGR